MKLDLRNKLTVNNWEKALHKFPLTARQGWTRQVKSEGLTVNLSKVGWVEPVAVVRVVLFIEAALIDGIKVTVNLPYPVATRAEQKTFDLAQSSKDVAVKRKAQNIAGNVRRRWAASVALRDLRFKESLLHNHLKQAPGELVIVDQYDWSAVEGRNAREASTDLPSRYPEVSGDASLPWFFDVVYGLQWIPDPRSREGRKIIDHLAEIDVLATILTHPSQRVSAADGATLSHVFLKELVENAVDHSGRQFALVAAMRRRQGYNLKSQEIYNCERDFASWCENYPLIEVMVGDSGSGIPNSLVDEYRRKQPPAPEKLKEASLNTRVLAWAFDKWSSRSLSDSKRGTRGLYRAERIVRKYDGCITLRSESSYAGVDCGSNNPPEYIYEQRLPKIPGTVVHVRLPVIPAERLPTRVVNPALHRASLEVVDFLRLNWNDVDQAIEFVCEETRIRSEGKAFNRRPTCLVLDFGFAKLERRTLEDLLLRLVEIAHPVALAIANVKAPSADSAQETIHSIAEQLAPEEGSKDATAELREATNVRDAILFQHTDGNFAWVGAPQKITNYLTQLWNNEQITPDELSLQIPDQAARNEIIRQFAEAYHVAHRSDFNGLSLNFNKQDISDTLDRYVSDLLSTKINKGSSAAIRTGKFRTPSLEIVSRYMNVKALLTEVGLDRATAVLARKCAAIGSLQDAKSVQIIADWTTSRDVLESFRDSLRRILQIPKSSFLISQVNAGEVPDVFEDSEIVLYTDVILAGDLISGLISQIVRARRTPTLVATSLDARSDEERGKPLSAMGRFIGVVALADIDIWVKNPERGTEPKNISPITHEPELKEGESSTYPISHEFLMQMVEDQNALYFDHIVRPNGRHLCFYLDPFRLLGALNTDDPFNLSDYGNVIIRAFEDEINLRLDEDEKLSVIYFPNLPRSERPSATKLLIGQKLSEKYGAQLLPVSSLTDVIFPEPKPPSGRVFQYRSIRAANTPQQEMLFDFPLSDMDLSSRESVSLKESYLAHPQTVAIIDWGSVTGTAIRASIRFAAARGASKILAIALLSQLPLDEERFLSSLTGFEHTIQRDGFIEIRQSEVKVIFLARYPTQVYEPRLCPYCRQLDRLAEEERFHPTKLLIDFIKEARIRLRQRSIDGEDGVRAEYQQRKLEPEENTKLPGFGDAYHVTTMAAIRNQIDMARTWTHARFSLYKDLIKLENPLNKDLYKLRMKRRCLIRLLAVEWLWLKREPLSMIKFKRQLSKLAVNTIKDQNCSEREKLDAIVVLRTASKDSFAQELPKLFDTVIQDKKNSEEEALSLISQMLYCAFTYLHRDYLMASTLEPLVNALGLLATQVHELLGRPNQTIALRIGRTVNSLHQYGRFLLHSLDHVTAPVAWRRLKEELGPNYHAHHPVCVAFDALRFGPLENDIEDSSKKLPRINWATKQKSWRQKCEPFITETLLPLLAPLREVFEGLDSRIMVGSRRAETLAIGERNIFSNIATLSDSLTVFSKNSAAVRQIGRWKNFVRARDSIWELLIDPGSQRSFREGGSALVRLLQDCPTNILSVLNELIAADVFEQKLSIRLRSSTSSDDTLVFCHTDVLRESVLELLRNITRHVRKPRLPRETESAPEFASEGIPVEMLLSEDTHYLELRIKNGGEPIEAAVHGRGLEMCAERLRPYEASVERDYDIQPPFVFAVRLRLLKG